MQLNSGSRGFRLLTPGNPKTEKGRGAGEVPRILQEEIQKQAQRKP